jgi:hypothetical protein
VIQWIGWAIAALLKPKALLVAENLCLRQQLVVLQRRQPRPQFASCRSAILGRGEAMVSRLARCAAHCPARDGLEMAPRRLEDLLALALKTPAERRTPPDFSRAEGAHSAQGLREPRLGSATDPSRVDAAGIQGLCPHRSEVPAPALWREPLTRLAAVSQAACAGYLGL